jgi:serine/threonine protein phosphatase PrpC
MSATGNNNWYRIGSSVKGASHKRSGKPNQDRIKFSDNQTSIMPLILAVADGHGSKAYFRSDKGAEFAVEIAIEVCKRLEDATWDTIKDKKINDSLIREIVQKWRERVNSDIQNNPFTLEEEAIFKPKKELIIKRPGGLNKDSVTAYGSTLIVAVIHNSFTLYLQLGDGNVLTVSSTGEIDQPLPKDDRLFGNETTSLCLPESWSDFRFRSLPLDSINQPPALILISTDGYSNSFSQDSEFEKVGKDLLEIICEHPDGIQEGIASIEVNLPDWLNTASEKGSGDDTTVGILCNLDQIKKYRNENYEVNIKKKVKISPNNEVQAKNDVAFR